MPHDEKRPFVKIFSHLLSQEEAEAALKLDASPVGVGEFAAAAGISAGESERLLTSLAEKGVVFVENIGGADKYSLMPYCPGIMEFLLNKYMDAAISEYLQEYVDELNSFKSGGRQIIQINAPVNAEIYHASYNEVMSYLKKASVCSLADCLCRTAAQKAGRGCGHTVKDM